MSHPIHRVASFTVVSPYTIDVSFTDGTDQRIDFRPVLEGPVFGALQNLRTFEQVVLDPEAGTLVWPNGADFDPATLHDWPDVREELANGLLKISDERANHRMQPAPPCSCRARG